MAFTIASSLPPASNLGIIFWNSYVIEMRGLSLECIKSLLNFAYILSEGASLRLLIFTLRKVVSRWNRLSKLYIQLFFYYSFSRKGKLILLIVKLSAKKQEFSNSYKPTTNEQTT